MNLALLIPRILLGITAIGSVGLGPQSVEAAPNMPPAASPAKAFPVRGFHVPFRPSSAPLSEYQKLIDELGGKDYNTVFLSLGAVGLSTFKIPEPGVLTTEGFTPADIQALDRQARSRGLELVLEVKLIGKQRAVLGGLAKKLPGLLCKHEGPSSVHYNQVINPGYVLPDGRDIFQAIVFPEIDDILGLHGRDKPKYLLLGIDEFAVDDLALCAKEKNTTAAALFADTLNRITAHVLAQGVTPIIWGDMLLSHHLARPGHGVRGFDHDPRMSHPQFAYHAEFQTKHGTSMVTAMNSLRRRNEIIVADWQYGPGDSNGEFPSVDYFQKMGFKDVWGTTWYNQTGIRNFSHYAAARGCGGMIASTWHTFFAKDVKHLLPVILRNSIVYFKDPNFSLPIENLPLTLSTGHDTPLTAGAISPLFQEPIKKVSFQAQVPPGVVPVEPVLRVEGTLGRQASLTKPVQVRMNYLAREHRLEGQVELPAPINRRPMLFETFVEFTCAGSGYFVQSHQRDSFGIVDQAPPTAGQAPRGALFYADFSTLTPQTWQGRLLRSGGKFGGLLFLEPSKDDKKPQDGGLDCRWMTAAYAYPPAALWDTLYTDGLRLRAEIRLGGGAEASQFPTIIGCGNFHSGFRVLLSAQRQVVVSIAGGKDGFLPLLVTAPAKVPANQWTQLELSLSPPGDHHSRTVSLRVGDAAPTVFKLPIDIIKSHAPLTLGSEFDTLGKLLDSRWKKFPGLIRTVELAPYAGASEPNQNHGK